MRFLLCLGVEPDLVEPGKPYHKPFVERSVRTLKYECLWLSSPENYLDAARILEVYRQFYNQDRANQSSACGNRPPYEAFVHLPALPHLPDRINPDAWLPHYHRQIFKRRVAPSGVISVGTHAYSIGYAHAGKALGVFLDAEQQVFNILHQGAVIQSLEIRGLIGREMSFED